MSLQVEYRKYYILYFAFPVFKIDGSILLSLKMFRTVVLEQVHRRDMKMIERWSPSSVREG